MFIEYLLAEQAKDIYDDQQKNNHLNLLKIYDSSFTTASNADAFSVK